MYVSMTNDLLPYDTSPDFLIIISLIPVLSYSPDNLCYAL